MATTWNGAHGCYAHGYDEGLVKPKIPSLKMPVNKSGRIGAKVAGIDLASRSEWLFVR